MSSQDFARKSLTPRDYFAISRQPDDSNRPGGGGTRISEKIMSDFPEAGRKYFSKLRLSGFHSLIHHKFT
ncbi:MAG: hypothetical protein WAK89_07535 [Candidatus Sulfotelmatobacter sp.]